MSECQHEYKTEKPRHWPQTCTHCGENKSDIEIAMLKAKLAVAVAACEAVIDEQEYGIPDRIISPHLENNIRTLIAAAKGEDDEAE